MLLVDLPMLNNFLWSRDPEPEEKACFRSLQHLQHFKKNDCINMALEVVSTSLRKRNAIASYGHGEADAQRTDFSPEYHSKPVQKKKRKGNPSPFELLSCLIHFAALSFIIWGFTLQSNFHNGDECEMTYSMLNYVPIKSPKSAHYKLYKFVDSRDARNPGIIRTKNDITDSSHCTANASIVVYIPGHWGSYTQCRSLGAHGTQLTRHSHTRDYTKKAYQSLADGTWNGVASEEENFVFDTYCIDFAEQGAGSHGNMIRKQADFVARVVEKLTVWSPNVFLFSSFSRMISNLSVISF